MKLLFSLLSLGTTIGGVFAGTLQQNLSHPETPEIDRLFHEIEKDIRDFSRDNPIIDSDRNYIKGITNSSDSNSRKKRDIEASQERKSKNTLIVWTTIWVGLINNYVRCLWQTCNKNLKQENKDKAVENSKKQYASEIKKFKEKLEKEKDRIDEIYEKMKEFVLKIEFPENYQYNSNDYPYGPYENYVEKILN